jgi:hypothetical protein
MVVVAIVVKIEKNSAKITINKCSYYTYSITITKSASNINYLIDKRNFFIGEYRKEYDWLC